MNRQIKTLAAAALAFGLAGTAFAQGAAPAKPEDAQRYRSSVMFVLAQHFGVLGAMARGDRPYDQAVATSHAATFESLTKLPWEAFWVAGSDKVKTRAKPEAFAEKDKFMGGAKKLQEEAAKLVAAAKSGDQGQLRTQFGATGGTCKACHDAYRSQ